MKILFCYVTCRNEAEAENIGEALVKGKLAGCAVVLHHAKSFFAWNGSVQRTAEALLLLKAPLRNKRKLEKEIKKMHSYDIPCILSWSAECSEDYGRWLENAVK
ncbi:divalent-cation tolerance protein CutA [Candidatus Micrarchaeota archaeon]|nr:divalent-cation tolerance protein CutA [Candidatus Micrarchaeota archaeon]